MTKFAVLFTTHRVNWAVKSRFRKLASDLPPDHDAFFVLDTTQIEPPARIDRFAEKLGHFFPFSRQDLETLPYDRAKNQWRGPSVFPGLCDLHVQYFYKLNPRYDWIYLVEYDVAFTGGWRVLFEDLASSSADLLATSISSKNEYPHWCHYADFSVDRPLAESDLLRAFMPFCRYSAGALQTLQEAYRRDWRGHFEALVPTAVHAAGLTVEDIGGDGPFVKAGNENSYYTSNRLSELLSPGSFVVRPRQHFPWRFPRDTLVHPVKVPTLLQKV